MMKTLFDTAWDLVKAPIYETGIPGIRFVTQGEDEPRWTDMDNVFGYVPSEPTEKDIERFTEMNVARNNYDSEGNYKEYRLPDKTAREVGDYFYRDLMDRAQAGEDILFGMPYIWPDMNVPGHEGVHRMSELFARGHGYKPVPVKIFRGGYSP